MSAPRKSTAQTALLGAALSVAAPFAGAVETPTQQITRAGTQSSVAGPAATFVGKVRVDPLFPADEQVHVSSAYVSFEPGARSAWHTHPSGQRLVVTSGVGLTQEWGKPVQQIHAGDVVVCPAGVKHWHGAAPHSAMTHLAVTGVADGKSVAWLEKVSDDQYREASAGIVAPVAGPLSPRQQAIPLIAAAAASSDMPQLTAALRRGLDAGLTLSETKEVLVQLYAYAGFPKSLNALGELMEVVRVRQAQGVATAPGQPHTRNVPVGDALRAVGTANQTRISGAPVTGPLMDFAPIINQYLQTHLFGDIFERDNLDWQSRELATVGALAVMPGVEAQLRSHMAASQRVGLSRAQLQHLAQLLAHSGYAAASARAVQALEQTPAPGP
ncbi:carboxymuconolactone decarboxylase family protein [Xanthomonas euroxanthea]|uniref:Cupin domain-containing protein n=2 Tax=Xanthomonas euroxanthea TaxID=2259622 RepID=A0AA46C8I7_9XANT|nr:carboxymuconolactone decarboxylase family protein [Xanthomonas euroxanthea]CAE1136311.1 carboxymuconolactone decarboxylase family protein [Xanthomonas euroxanthea]SUZ28366.1 cupin domain-containing protein [Xanthomonas euroxanthea]